MSIVNTEPSAQERSLMRRWMRDRPPAVQRRCHEFPPGIYRLRSTGRKVLLTAYELSPDQTQCDTCRVRVLPELNPGLVLIPRAVFGIAFADLEPIEVAEWVREL